MVGKKGMFKTLEALIALFMTLLFLVVFIPREAADIQTEPKGFLSILREDDGFRNCIIQKNVTCINQTIDNSLEDNFDFKLNLSEEPSTTVSGLPDVQVFSESLFITGNVTNSTTAILRVFYWNK
ncbi:hypothetical protein J4470_04800 [Candidatus Woesearchaeota archaeon]|nr:hypothetical protein [Candidatus Woesearchaeota archaeon]